VGCDEGVDLIQVRLGALGARFGNGSGNQVVVTPFSAALAGAAGESAASEATGAARAAHARIAANRNSYLMVTPAPPEYSVRLFYPTILAWPARGGFRR